MLHTALKKVLFIFYKNSNFQGTQISGAHLSSGHNLKVCPLWYVVEGVIQESLNTVKNIPDPWTKT